MQQQTKSLKPSEAWERVYNISRRKMNILFKILNLSKNKITTVMFIISFPVLNCAVSIKRNITNVVYIVIT